MQRTAPELTRTARRLRRDATPAERILWQILRQQRPRWTRQMVIGSAVVDFACRSVRLIVELDGGHHALQLEADAVRTARLEADGWTVLRFWNNDVIENEEAVAARILAAVAQASTHPQPLPSREGS